MISVIICSANPDLLAALELNIGQTIGVPYEIIAVDNRDTRYGICQAYNKGARQAQYSVLCFIHEDIIFETQQWGLLLCDHLANTRTGLVGLAGGDAKSLVPSSWSVPIVSNEINLVQHYKLTKAPPQRILVTRHGVPAARNRVVALDGVLLCTRRDVFDQFKFDETTFTGFHGYDIDYSLQVNTRYEVFVIFDILIRHLSEGRPDDRWIDSAILLSRKWKSRLPVSIDNVTQGVYNLHHWQSLQIFLERLFQLNYPFRTIAYHFFRYSFTRFFSFRRFFSMGKYVTGTLYKKYS